MSNRQVVLDTETTGLNPDSGHRIIEIGCIELIDRKLTNRNFHTYLNPQRAVDEGARRVHGLSNEFLNDKPLFEEQVHALITFIKDAELIIHNAPFDVGFLNAELALLNWPNKIQEICAVCDTLVLAREKHPGQRNSLDALCKRYSIDNSKRQLHGALLDAEILAAVYLAMTGGQGRLFEDDTIVIPDSVAALPTMLATDNSIKQTPVVGVTETELAQHETFLTLLRKKSGVDLWKKEETLSEAELTSSE